MKEIEDPLTDKSPTCNNYIKISDFNNYVNEYEEFKRHITDRLAVIGELSAEKQSALNAVEDLRIQNQILINELKNKELIIEILKNETRKSDPPSQTWSTVGNNKVVTGNVPANPIELRNSFEVLEIEPSYEVQDDSAIFQRKRSQHGKRSKDVINDSMKRNGFPIDNHPDNNTLTYIHESRQKRTVPGQTTYANIVSNGKKIAVYRDSLVKRIKTHEFNRHVNGKAFIKSFPGANCVELNHYIDFSLKKDRPDCVVIHVGTNELTNKQQKDNGVIANEIVETARKCRRNGVNDIFISGIVNRASFDATRKLKDINDKVRDICIKEGYHFICNESITKEYLWKDGIHLLDEGTVLLANNFINAINTI